MDIKKYRVVCTKPEMSDDIYIDIAPDSGVIHDQIFFSRLQLNRQTGGQPMHRLYGSIYLEDNNGELSVDFPPIQAKEGTPDYDKKQKEFAALKPRIIECYQNMREAGMESTLFIYDIDQMFEKTAEIVAISETDNSYMRKHFKQLAPQNPQEEKLARQREEFNAVRQRRIASEQKRMTDKIPAWRRFQNEYSGD